MQSLQARLCNRQYGLNGTEAQGKSAEINRLLQEIQGAPKAGGPDALLRQKVKQKRFREGYEEGLSTLHRPASAAAFVASEQPVEMLGQYTRRASSVRRELGESETVML